MSTDKFPDSVSKARQIAVQSLIGSSDCGRGLRRDSTEDFKDVSVVEAEGYALQSGCVGGLDSGAMGPRYINGAIVGRGEFDPTHPRFEIHEPTVNGGLKLIGADFLSLR